MNNRIANKTIIHVYKRKFCHSTILKQNGNVTRLLKSCNIYSNSSQYLVPKKFSNKILFYETTTIGINFQTRSISNDALISSDIDNESKPSASDLSTVEQSAAIISSNLPEFIKTASDWKIVDIAQQSLLKVHEITGLPWWASITLTAFIARTTITLPFSIIMMHNTAKLQMVQIKMDDIVKKLKREANYACTYHGWPESLARQNYNKAVRREYKNLIVQDNCHPAKSYIFLLMQLPLWFSFSFAIRNLCYMLPKPDTGAQITYMEMMVGGFGWVKNLTDVDHYFILPISIAITNLAIMEIHQMFKTTPFTKFDKLRKYIFRGFSLIMVPIAASVPSALNFYWISSSLFGLVQAFLLNSPRFRRIFKVPVTKDELKNPYSHFYSQLKSKLTRVKEN